MGRALATSPSITVLVRDRRRLAANRSPVDTRAVRQCVDCRLPFFSTSTGNVVCRHCKAASKAVFS